MIQIGITQNLKVKYFNRFGAHLYEESKPEETVLLPKDQLPRNLREEDEIEVFVYRDSKGDLISTVNQPYIELGQTRLLTVRSKTKIGAFMDMGLDRDVLLPFSEMVGQVKEGESFLVRMYVDKSLRLAVTMKIRDYLKKDSPYNVGDTVTGTIYSVSKKHGLFVAVNDEYDAIIPSDQAIGIYRVGEFVSCEVINKNENGLMLSIESGAQMALDEDAERLLDLLEDKNGVLKVGSGSKKSEIKSVTKLHADSFYRAIDKLIRENEIMVSKNEIRLKKLK